MYSLEVDQKWQKVWRDTNLYKFDENNLDKKYYCLEMFSYPSGANLHLGHWYNYALSDVFARFKRMQGYNVFQPMGYDAFGLPAENYAIKTGVHPKDSTEKSIKTMTKQLKEMGAMFNWEYSFSTHNESYYKWTQWLFLQLYKNNLAYRKKAPANWCPSCMTTIANEQVIGGMCERCNSAVYKKELTQWFFRITDYADELVDGIKDLDWPEKTKKVQTNWIGRSYGSEVVFDICDMKEKIKVYTTRADTLLGATYIVIAPEHPLVANIIADENKTGAEKYITETGYHNEIERLSSEREKTGVFTGTYAIHPINGTKLPIWIADYVILGYGTGCVMAVPAHDRRDYEFAVKYDLEIIQVIKKENRQLPIVEYGTLINSGDFTKNYRLHDWLVSRQRYWGTPIPIIYCENCGIVAVAEKDLPVRLPYDVVFKTNGISPLQNCDEFLHTTCPECGEDATRETDTLDTFVCSSWYYLRYPDSKNSTAPFDKEKINKFLPVDKYVGGAEHATMHLLYARFITKALRDIGYLEFDEPFLSLTHQGNILGSNGKRMSKSHPEFAVAPDEYTNKYGSDVLRLYLAFGFAYNIGGSWDENGIKAIARFVSRVERIIKLFDASCKQDYTTNKNDEKLNYTRNNTIKSITIDIEKFKFNTSIARIMEFTNALEDIVKNKNVSYELLAHSIDDFVKLLAPFAPHLCEELWNRLGNEYSVFNQTWPVWEEIYLEKKMVEIVVQINGKIRGTISAPKRSDKKSILKLIYKDAKLKNRLADKEIKKMILIPDKIVSILI